MSKRILVVDDEVGIRQVLAGALEDEGYQVICASNGIEAISALKLENFDAVLLDIWMPDLDGIEVLKQIKRDWPDQAVIMMTGHGTIETAVKATKLGAQDFIEKPLSLERLLLVLKNVTEVRDLVRENQALRKQVKRNKMLVAQSPQMLQIQEMIRRVAPTTGSVLITGENGTGKELVAHSVHALSQRFNKPFIDVNCAAIPEELIESELFGHEKGAFTGALQQRKGKFDLASGGTLFLDEIGDMSLKTQAKILRILQEQKYERVGGTQTIHGDVRIIAATNKDLKQEIQKGTFREDLFYRLNVVPFHIPPLRERKEDIELLVKHFLKESALGLGRPERTLSAEAIKVLLAYSWPGNVRELKNLMERILILTPESHWSATIQASEMLEQLGEASSTKSSSSLENVDFTLSQQGYKSDLLRIDPVKHEAAKPGNQSMQNLKEARQEFEKEYMLKCLKENDWNISKTAALLGVERSHFYKKMKSFGIGEPEA